MPYEVLLMPAAEQDLDELLGYLVVQLHAEQAAGNLLKEYGEVVNKLSEFPAMFEFSRVPGHKSRGYRKFLLGDYVALYQIDEDKKVVWIARIFHGSQNYQKYL